MRREESVERTTTAQKRRRRLWKVDSFDHKYRALFRAVFPSPASSVFLVSPPPPPRRRFLPKADIQQSVAFVTFTMLRAATSTLTKRSFQRTHVGYVYDIAMTCGSRKADERRMITALLKHRRFRSFFYVHFVLNRLAVYRPNNRLLQLPIIFCDLRLELS